MNVILFLITFLFQKNLIGLGTLVNMTAIGYVADFFGSVWDQIEIFHNPMPMMLRLVILAGALAVFVLTAAVYMTAQLGMAPYDTCFVYYSETGKKAVFSLDSYVMGHCCNHDGDIVRHEIRCD